MFFMILAVSGLTFQTVSGGSIVEAPKDATVEWQAETVRLECQVANFTSGRLSWGYIGSEFDILYWIWPNGDVTHVGGANERFQNFAIETNGTNHDMVIADVEIEDEGEYACYFGTKPDRGAKLIVVAQPQVWIESNEAGPTIEVVEGEEVVDLKCWAERGHPPADLVWLKDGQEIPCYNTDWSRCYGQVGASNGTTSTYSSNTLIPTARDHNHTVECQSRQILDLGERANASRDAVVLYVLYAPKVLVEWDVSLREAECSASANPGNNLTYQWRVNGEWDGTACGQTKWSLGNRRGRLKISCQVTNSLGSGSDAMEIYIEECSATPSDSPTRTSQNYFPTEKTTADPMTTRQETTDIVQEQMTTHLANSKGTTGTTKIQKTSYVSESTGTTAVSNSKSVDCPDSANSVQTENANVTLIIQVILVALVCSEAIVIVTLTLLHFKPKPKHVKQERNTSTEIYNTTEI